MPYRDGNCEERYKDEDGEYCLDSGGDVIAKLCSACRKLLPISDFLGGRCKNLYGSKTCIRCREKEAKRREKRKEYIREYRVKYYAENRERIKERNTEWYVKNREHALKRRTKRRVENMESERSYSAKWYANNSEKLKKKRSSFIHQDRSKKLIDTAMKYLTIEEKPEIDEEGYLSVLCKLCRLRFRPTYRAVENRLAVLKGKVPENSLTENNLYCSQDCKDSCVLYRNHGGGPAKKHVSVFDEARDPAFRKLMLERHGSCCEICGSTKNIEVHHEIPVSESYIRSADEDNAVVVCHTCHMRMHDQPGCFLHELANKRKQCQKNAA